MRELSRCLIPAVLIGLVAGMSGCASIMSGTTQSLLINSNPSGATVEVDGLQARTPAKLELKRNQASHSVRIKKEGFETAQLSIGRQFNPWVAGNLFWGYGFPIGVLVDLVTGGAWDLENDSLNVSLSPETEDK